MSRSAPAADDRVVPPIDAIEMSTRSCCTTPRAFARQYAETTGFAGCDAPQPLAGRSAALQAQTLQHRLIAPPLRGGLHLQLQVDRVPEDRLDVRPCASADLAHHRPALPDQDLLLALGLGVEPHVDALVVDLDDLRRDGVGNLFL